jgi:hypothetical protein
MIVRDIYFQNTSNKPQIYSEEPEFVEVFKEADQLVSILRVFHLRQNGVKRLSRKTYQKLSSFDVEREIPGSAAIEHGAAEVLRDEYER